MLIPQRVATVGAANNGPGGAPPPSTVDVTMPPVSWELSEEIMRDMGRLGSQIAGHHWLLGSTHYVWYRHDGVGLDPAVAGRTGIEVTLVAGNRTGAQVATATAAAIDAVSGLSATATDEDVAVTGAGTASAGTVTWDTADSTGVLGTGTPTLAGLNSFDSVAACSMLLASSLPSGPFYITGYRVAAGTTHTAQMIAAVYQGGATDADTTGAALLGYIGSTTGSATNTNIYVPAEAPVYVDPSLGRVRIMWMATTGGFGSSYPFNAGNPDHVAAMSSSDWVGAGTNSIQNLASITPSSTPGDFPATLPAVSSNASAVTSIAVSFMEASYQNDMRVTGRFGTRAAAADLTSTSSNTLLVGNSYTSPATLGMTVRNASVAYASHTSGSDYRLSFASGGTAFDNWSGATFSDIGRATGTATGWVTVTPAAGTIAIPASSRVWFTIHKDGGASSLAFAEGPADTEEHSPAAHPAAYYNGGPSESEADDGSLGGTAATIDFDEGTAQSGVLVNDGTNYTNDNNTGTRGEYEVLGFAVS